MNTAFMAPSLYLAPPTLPPLVSLHTVVHIYIQQSHSKALTCTLFSSALYKNRNRIRSRIRNGLKSNIGIQNRSFRIHDTSTKGPGGRILQYFLNLRPLVLLQKKIRLCRNSPPKSQDTLPLKTTFTRHGNSYTRVRSRAPALVDIKLGSSVSGRVLALQPLLHDDEKVFVKKGS